jgi:hypothetical protein
MKRLLEILIFGWIMLFCLVNQAAAADLKLSFNARYKQNAALLYGEILPGDTQKVARFFIKYPEVQFLILDSRGGDVIEAIRIGELVQTLRISTEVDDRGMCASSCFFMWMNGAYRLAVAENYRGGSGPVGLHRPFLVNPKNSEGSLQLQSKVMIEVRNYLETNLIPRRLIDIMMTRPSNDIYWLTSDDIEELSPIPPALEELYIAKCQANNRQLSTQHTQAIFKNDLQEKARVQAQLRTMFDCTNNLDLEANAAATKKLASGWLPPVPFKEIRKKGN